VVSGLIRTSCSSAHPPALPLLLGRFIGELSCPSGFARWVLDERKHPASHESGRANGFAGPGHLGDLDDAAPGRDLDPATRARGEDLVRPRAVVCSDNDFHTIALHRASVPRLRSAGSVEAHARERLRQSRLPRLCSELLIVAAWGRRQARFRCAVGLKDRLRIALPRPSPASSEPSQDHAGATEGGLRSRSAFALASCGWGAAGGRRISRAARIPPTTHDAATTYAR
jgi:hypothetical protein